MARIRTIKPEFPQSQSLGRVSRDARLLFVQMFTLADDEGRLRGSSRMLASLLFPYDDDAPKLIDGWIDELAREKMIVQYEADDDQYIEILKWLKHQKIDHPTKSKFPAPHESALVLAKPREASLLDQGRDQGKEGKPFSPEPLALIPSAETAPTAIVFVPLVDKTEFLITQVHVDEWKLAYPGIDVVQELREVRAWCLTNPANRKTKRGVMRFLNGWLGRQQDRARRTPGVAAPTPPASGPRRSMLDELTADARSAGLTRGVEESIATFRARVAASRETARA